MTEPVIKKGENHFFNTIYSGNGRGQRVGNFLPFEDSGTISKSLMFNNVASSANHYLRIASLSEGNNQIATFSAWIKFTGPFAPGSDLNTNYGGILEQGNGNWTSSSHFMFYQTRGRLDFYHNGSSILRTNRYFQDSSKWYHIMFVLDVTQDAPADRLKFYVDGTEETDVSDSRHSLNKNTDLSYINVSGQELNIGGMPSGNGYEDLNCYMAEVNYIDGTAYGPSTFGLTDTSTGRWIPKTLSGITYGTNGFRLQFGTDTDLGNDTSGENNDLTPNNFTPSDQRTDTPTNNLPIMRNYSPSYQQTLGEGNLQHTTVGSNKFYPVVSTLRPKGSGKFYAECRVSDVPGGYSIQLGCYAYEDLKGYGGGAAYFGNTGYGSGLWIEQSSQYMRYNNITVNTTPFTFSAGDVIGMALDLDNGVLSFYDDDNGFIGSVTYDRTKSAAFAGVSNKAVTFIWNFGDNPTFDGLETAGGNADADGNGNFFKSVPSGYKVLKQDNMPETTKFTPDLAWFKNRNDSDSFQLYNTSVGPNKSLTSDDTAAELTAPNGLQKFLKGGYSIEDDVRVNRENDGYVAWNWLCDSGTTSANTSATPTIASTIQANANAGFSIVEYTGTGTAGTVEHGLSQAPEWVMVKSRSNDTGDGFTTYHSHMTSATYYLRLHNSSPEASASTVWDSAAPSPSVVSIGTSTGVNINTYTYLMYCWHSVAGFSKFGSYKGNNDPSGPFVYTGFKPSWLLVKCINTTGRNWILWDNKRSPINPCDNVVYPDLSQAETASGNDMDFLSNGFKPRGTNTNYNGSNDTYVYMAFAEHPFIGSGRKSPVTAR